MNRYAKDTRQNPKNPKPVERIELPSKISKKRIISFIIAVVIAGIAFATAINSLIEKQNGWRQIELKAGSSAYEHVEEIAFSYELGKNPSLSATEEYKILSNIYTSAMEEAYNNLNSETILPEMAIFGDYLYMEPIYNYYQSIFFSTDDSQAVMLDPKKNNDAFDYIKSILGQKEVWGYSFLSNAYVVDYIANKLIEEGYTDGVVASFDGFSRRIQTKQTQVVLRANPKIMLDMMHYYQYKDGTIINSYISPKTGLCLDMKNDIGYIEENNINASCVKILSDILQNLWNNE